MMFGKKKYSREDVEQIEKNLELGTWFIQDFSDKKEWVASNYDRINRSREQMEADIERIMEHINSATEVAKNESEVTASLSYELDTMRQQLDAFEGAFKETVEMITNHFSECQNLVEDNKHFTTPSKIMSELPNEWKNQNNSYRGSLEMMSEQGKQMGVLALNAAIEAGRMGEQGRQFVTAAEEIRNYSKKYEETVRELSEKIDASDAKIAQMEDVIHHLIGMLKESNMGIAHLMKDCSQIKKHVDGNAKITISEDIKRVRDSITQLHNGSEEIIKSEERSRMQMDDISEEIEGQRNCEQEVIGELQKLFDEAARYIEGLPKEEV